MWCVLYQQLVKYRYSDTGQEHYDSAPIALSLSAYTTCTDICSILMPIVFHRLEDRISCFVIYINSNVINF